MEIYMLYIRISENILIIDNSKYYIWAISCGISFPHPQFLSMTSFHSVCTLSNEVVFSIIPGLLITFKEFLNISVDQRDVVFFQLIKEM